MRDTPGKVVMRWNGKQAWNQRLREGAKKKLVKKTFQKVIFLLPNAKKYCIMFKLSV